MLHSEISYDSSNGKITGREKARFDINKLLLIKFDDRFLGGTLFRRTI